MAKKKTKKMTAPVEEARLLPGVLYVRYDVDDDLTPCPDDELRCERASPSSNWFGRTPEAESREGDHGRPH